MTARESGRWWRRAAGVLAVWALAWAFTAWWYLRPDPLGLLGLVLVGATICWLLSDHRQMWDAPTWTAVQHDRRMRTAADSRLSYLRRLTADAGAEADATNTASLQALLRELTLQRLTGSHPGARPADPAQALTRADPDLARYLLADPPPRLDHRHLSTVVDQIEALQS